MKNLMNFSIWSSFIVGALVILWGAYGVANSMEPTTYRTLFMWGIWNEFLGVMLLIYNNRKERRQV